MKDIIKIGNAQAFWGDSSDAAAHLLQLQPDLDFLTLDYLSEVSLSIMAIQREKDAKGGYAKDFLDVVRSLAPFWKKGSKVKVIANAGGLNPYECAVACQQILNDMQCSELKIGVVFGDDVLSKIQASFQDPLFNNLENGKPISGILNSLSTANAYLGAKPIVDALDQGADIVITGRVTDSSLTLAPCIASFKWEWNDYDRLAAGTVAGHLIECGTQVTGGISTHWLQVPDPANIGFPVVEVSKDGSFVITKPANTGGIVSIETVKEQLLYEIGDPDQYLTPDVKASFLSLKLDPLEKNRIKITGAKGRAPPPSYKVSASYKNGFKTEGMLTIYGDHIHKKAHLCGTIILEHVKRAGYVLDKSCIECIGCGDVVPGIQCEKKSSDSMECVLRIAASDHRKEALECLSRMIASMVTSGPPGTTGYTSGRPPVRPVYEYWPCLIEKSLVVPKVQMIKGGPS